MPLALEGRRMASGYVSYQPMMLQHQELSASIHALLSLIAKPAGQSTMLHTARLQEGKVPNRATSRTNFPAKFIEEQDQTLG